MPDTTLPGHYAALGSAHNGDIQGAFSTIRQANRRAQRSLHMLPAYVWVRPATIAIFWSHRNNGLSQMIGGHRRTLGRMDPVRPGVLASGATPTHSPAKTRATAVAWPSRAVMAHNSARSALQALQRRAGMAAYFAGAQLVLAVTHHLNRGGLLSQGGLGVALGAARSLTRAGMSLWRNGSHRQKAGPTARGGQSRLVPHKLTKRASFRS